LGASYEFAAVQGTLDVFHDFGRGLVSLCRVGDEHPREHGLILPGAARQKVRADRKIERRHRLSLAVDGVYELQVDPLPGGNVVTHGVWGMAGPPIVGRGPETVDVGANVRADRVFSLLRGDVLGRAQKHAARCREEGEDLLKLPKFHKPKVRHLGNHAFGRGKEHDVVGFEVAVHSALCVDEFENLGHPKGDTHLLVEVELLAHLRRGDVPRHEFHDAVDPVPRGLSLRDGEDDAGLVHADGERLALDPRNIGNVLEGDLDRAFALVKKAPGLDEGHHLLPRLAKPLPLYLPCELFGVVHELGEVRPVLLHGLVSREGNPKARKIAYLAEVNLPSKDEVLPAGAEEVPELDIGRFLPVL